MLQIYSSSGVFIWTPEIRRWPGWDGQIGAVRAVDLLGYYGQKWRFGFR